jgi:N-acetylneuraminic acid mutarotase
VCYAVLQKGGGLLQFGGEHWDRKVDRVAMFSDIYLYYPAKDSWTRVDSPGPHPRSACAGALHKGCLYMFGGEFTSPNQAKFRHFRDLWRLDLSTYAWDELPVRAGPSARSGHRMLCHKGRIYLFGGYYDAGDTMKYYNDLWMFDVDEWRWEALGDVRAKWPAARSGFQWVLHGDQIVMHGGYAKARDEEDAELEHGVALEDTWVWDIPTCKVCATLVVARAL